MARVSQRTPYPYGLKKICLCVCKYTKISNAKTRIAYFPPQPCNNRGIISTAALLFLSNTLA